MIDRTTIDRIFDAARIVDVVSEFVTLKRRGVNYIGCCPFHNERTPSFVVSPAKNIYKCFGCGKAGNSVNFIMDHEHLGYPEALRYLAKKYGILVEEKEPTPEEKQQSDFRESLLVVSAYAARIFQDQLFNTREGTAIGLSYFKERAFRDDIIKSFELGYCFELRDAFTRKALKDGYKEEFLVETGLTIKTEDRGVFDRFSGRVVFPIHSLAGKVIAFGGRVLKTDKKVAKYLNSPESDIYHKSKILYGIYQAKKSIGQNDKCFLVEGYTDVLSMHQAGIENVVASSGTALTVEQIQLIKRFTPNITVLYDGDPAGIKASLRGIDLILQEDMNVKVLLLPDGEDPDSFARSRSASELEAHIRVNETDFITFKARLLLEDAKNDPLKRSQLITDVVQSIALIPQAIKRSVFLKDCARMFEIDEQILTETADVMRRKKTDDQRRADARTASPDTGQPEAPNLISDIGYPTSDIEKSTIDNRQSEIENAELQIIRLLLRYGPEMLVETDEETGEAGMTVADYIIRELCMDELDLQQPVLQKTFEEYRQLISNGAIVNDKYFTQHPDPDISRLAAGFEPKYELSNMYKRDGVTVKTEENNLREVVPAFVLAYKSKRVLIRLKEISLTMQQAEKDNDIDRFETLCMQHRELTQLRSRLTTRKRIYN